MRINNFHIIKNLVTAIVVTLFFSCNNDINDVGNIGKLQNQPIAEAENINLKYTEYKDSTVRIIANLLSPKMLDYSNRRFKFQEFPNGVELKIYDDNNNQTTITSNYAIVYTDTDIIDLRGNVKIATHTKDTLFTDQLYYNQKLEWAFTNMNFVYKSLTNSTHGIGFDSDKEFKNWQMLEMGGDFELDN